MVIAQEAGSCFWFIFSWFFLWRSELVPPPQTFLFIVWLCKMIYSRRSLTYWKWASWPRETRGCMQTFTGCLGAAEAQWATERLQSCVELVVSLRSSEELNAQVKFKAAKRKQESNLFVFFNLLLLIHLFFMSGSTRCGASRSQIWEIWPHRSSDLNVGYLITFFYVFLGDSSRRKTGATTTINTNNNFGEKDVN